MLPRWHVFWGAIFTGIMWIAAPTTHWFYLLLVFLSAVFIDLDHYLAAAWKTKKISLFESFRYHDRQSVIEKKERAKGIRIRGDFHLFHTVEFIALVGLLGLLSPIFLYIFIGLVFHSLLDILYIVYHDRFYRREFFFFNWLRKST